MYWITESIQENNLEKKEWGVVIDEAWHQYIREMTKINYEKLKEENLKVDLHKEIIQTIIESINI